MIFVWPILFLLAITLIDDYREYFDRERDDYYLLVFPSVFMKAETMKVTGTRSMTRMKKFRYPIRSDK